MRPLRVLRVPTGIGLAAMCLLTFATVQSPAAEELPPDLVPYAVSLSIEFDGGSEFSPSIQARSGEGVRRLIDRFVGERWSLTKVETSGIDSFADLDRITPAVVPVDRTEPTVEGSLGFPAEDAPDKFLFVRVSRRGPSYLAASREWDRLTDTLGPTRSATVPTREEIPRAILSAALAAFRPIALVGAADDASATLVPRAAGIPARDPAVELASGEIFTVVLRKRDRDGAITEVKPVPFTYLETLETGRGSATAAVRSALRRPLSGRRGRVEAWAVAAPPLAESTRLTVVRRDDRVPLPGRVVEVRSAPAAPGKEEPAPDLSLLADRSGSVGIPVRTDRPLLWLTVKSGDATLMRLPLAPGVEPAVTLPLGDDQRRLDAESRIAIVTGELIETVAKRATLLAKARTRARTGRYDDADAALAEAAKLADVASFRRRLAAVETPAAEAAEQAGDRMAAARIRALGRQSVALVDRYLNPEALKTTREEVEELKRTDPDRIPAQPPQAQAKPAPPPKPTIEKAKPTVKPKKAAPAGPQF